ncbi:MAG: hypothetical protein NT027_08970 [Proteobacteria bacterium]|nr:hypothetical protein [Pseudomonadota bacterium]
MNNLLYRKIFFVGVIIVGISCCGLSEYSSRDEETSNKLAGETQVPDLNLDVSVAAAGKTIIGPFVPAPAFSFYLVNNPANCKARIKVTSILGENGLLRVYRVNQALGTYSEILQDKFLVSLPKAASSQSPTTKVYELTALPASTPSTMIEIRLSTGQNRLKAYFEADCDIKDADYGVSFQNGIFYSWRGLAAESLFAYIPYHSEVLVLANKGKAPINVSGVNPNGIVDATAKDYGPVNGPVTVPPGKSVPIIPKQVSWSGVGVSDVLWKIDLAEANWSFAAGGFPLILSPSAAAVKRIRGAMVFDGKRVLAHAFQRDYLNSLRGQMVYKIGSTSKLIEDFATMITRGNVTLGAFPNGYLTNAYYGVLTDLRSAIETQNLNPASEWLGSSDGWQLRDPTSPSFPGTSVVVPSEIYASSADNNVWQLVIRPITGATNQRVANTVNIVKGGVKSTIPLSDPTHWNRLSIAAPLTLTEQTVPDPANYIANNQGQMVHGVSKMDDTLIPSMALLATLDGSKAHTPFENPFYGQKAILYRVALASLTDLAALPESEIWNSIETDLNGPYAGGNIAFTMGRKVLISYGETAYFLRKLFCTMNPTEAEKKKYSCAQFPFPALSNAEIIKWGFAADEIVLWKQIHSTWTDGARRIAYRLYPNDMVSCRNQSAHYLLAFQQLALGSGDPFDASLVTDYVDRWVQSQDKSGYFMEQQGPDASYIGMTNYHAAAFYLTSCMTGTCNQKIKDSIAKTYRFFGYTVAPEPNSTTSFLGGFNFNHRVGAGYHAEQFGGARGIALDIPEVSAWTEAYLAPLGKNPRRVPSVDSYKPGSSRRLDLFFPRFHAFQEVTEVTPAKFPATTPGSFTIDVHDAKQLIAVKRPGYYTAFYVGRPAPHPTYIAPINDPKHRLSWKDSGESAGASIGDPHYWNAPYVGGGMSLFWTPEFGSSVLAGSWTPLVHHGLVSVDGINGVRSWEEYFSTNFEQSPDKSTLTTSGKLESKPCVYARTPQELCSGMDNYKYSRTYTFLDDTINVSTSIVAESNAVVSLNSILFENIPLAGGKPKMVGTVGPSIQIVSPQEIVYRRGSTGPGTRIRFKNTSFANSVNSGPMNSEKLQINRLELGIAIPAPGQTSKILYCIQPISADAKKCGF